MEEKKETFIYTYSAKEQEEIKKIRDKYAPPSKEETAIEQLRRLDSGTTKGAFVVSTIVGIVSTSLLGVGMCCVMIPDWKLYFFYGILIGIVGIVGMISARPIYAHIVKRNRAKVASEIIRLSDELLTILR